MVIGLQQRMQVVLPALLTIPARIHAAGNFVCVHVSLVPVIGVVGEQKTKPTQHSVATLRSLGINPALLACRSSEPLQDSVRSKLVRGGRGSVCRAGGWASGCRNRVYAGAWKLGYCGYCWSTAGKPCLATIPCRPPSATCRRTRC